MKPQTSDFTFRQPNNLTEMEQLLRLRYEVFRISRPNLVPKNDWGLDVDAYDAYARHFGLYYKGQPCGYVRVIGCKKRTKTGSMAMQIYQACVGTERLPNRPYLLPLMDYYPMSKEVLGKQMQQLEKEGREMVEVSRICVLPDFRNVGAGKALAFALFRWHIRENRENIAVLSCKDSSVSFYEKMGFRPYAELPQSIKSNKLTVNAFSLLLLDLHAQPQQKAIRA